tara:strand:- start:545 stop:1216 length:672 start_codon:yes stop_codon:yes gene_type:complete
MAGLVPGTDEYKQFMLNEGGEPATYRALVLQAKAAGYEEGTPEFARFMAARGAFERSLQTAQGVTEAEENQSLAVMQRNLPGLYTLTDELSVLADAATYNAAGRAMDTVLRETGQPMSEGGQARAAYISKIDNAVLPLLRQTFGAAFTVEEGERLRATLGDENSSPEEKKAALSAFISQKERQVLEMGGVLPGRTVAPAAPTTAAGATTRSDEDLLKQYGVEK